MSARPHVRTSHVAREHYTHAVPPQTTAWLARVQLGLAAIALLMLFFVVPLALTGDGHGRWGSLSAFIRTGELPLTRYSYIGPLFASPFFLFDSRQTEMWWVIHFNVIVLAVGAAAIWWMLRGAVAPLARASFLLLLVAGGMMPYHVRDFYGEVFTAVFVASGLALVIAREQRLGWVPVVLGVANMPGTAVGLLLVAVWRFWRARRYDGLIAVACAAAMVLAENVIVRGDVFATGYAGDHGARTIMPFSGRPGFSYPLLLGAVSLLFSFGKGLLFFAPGLLLVRHARRHSAPAIVDLLDASMLFVAGVLLVYARWWAWYGGWYWGPRFLLIAVYPSALALGTALASRATPLRYAATALAAVWTIWVGASGAVFGQHGLDICMENTYALEHLCWYAPEFSPLFRPLVIRASLNAAQGAWMLLAAAALAALVLPSLWRVADALPAPGALKRFPPSQSS
jgi:hypothetical protein